ncbi:MAG: DUF5320 domain-containing protein [Dehalococcoidales bacterium]|nr:DUF5320 domain-containing protein [Dehalococcoidales bacterium]MDD4465115.1 DUF5320 domain-containing protein [Dehalococcoidales bacterium]
MPGLDRTGPAGMGPMTGGGRGMCNPGVRQGFGRYASGFRGLGRYNRVYAAQPVPDFDRMDLEELKSQMEALKNELKALENQIENLSGEK